MSTGNLTRELVYWITERDLIREKKEAGWPKPWTEDEVLRTTRFTNVRREDDKVTEWIAHNWRDGKFGTESFIPALVLARFINRPETLAEIGYPDVWQPARIETLIRARALRGELVWGNAYMITTCGVKMAKEEYVVNVANAVYVRLNYDPPPWNTCEEMHQWLMRTKGLGSFLAAQVVADLKNTDCPLSNALDWSEWCASGPGSRKGLNYYMGRPPESPWTEKGFRYCIAEVWEEVVPLLPPYLQDIHMQDFQNCFCEFSKYMRIKNGGRAKNRYPG